MQITLKDSEYTFDASTKEITLVAPYDNLSMGQVISIVDLPAKSVIYLSHDFRYSISIVGAVITHTTDNSYHADTDKLQIVIDVQTEGKTPTIYNKTMTLADTEYSQVLPANTKKFEFRCRDADDIRFAYVTGKVAGPTAPYRVLLSGEIKSENNINLSDKTLYFACANPGKIMEIETWA